MPLRLNHFLASPRLQLDSQQTGPTSSDRLKPLATYPPKLSIRKDRQRSDDSFSFGLMGARAGFHGDMEDEVDQALREQRERHHEWFTEDAKRLR